MDTRRQIFSFVERLMLGIPRSVNFLVIAMLFGVLSLLLERDHGSASAETVVSVQKASYARVMTDALKKKLVASKAEKAGITLIAESAFGKDAHDSTHLVLRIRGLRVGTEPRAYQALLSEQNTAQPINAELVMTTRVFANAAGTEMLRIDARLINSDDGFKLWGHRFVSELTDLDAIYVEICRALNEAMEHTVDGASEGQIVHNTVSARPGLQPQT